MENGTKFKIQNVIETTKKKLNLLTIIYKKLMFKERKKRNKEKKEGKKERKKVLNSLNEYLPSIR